MKQQELFKVICADLEQERPNDSAEVKSDRFKKVLDNMKKVKNRISTLNVTFHVIDNRSMF